MAINSIASAPVEHRIEIGDLVPRAGIYTKPGVVVEKKADGNVVIDTDPVKIDHYHRYAITTGLTQDEKEQFNSIMDEIMSMQDAGDQLNGLQSVIDDLKNDPSNSKVTRALHNEQAVLIRRSQELPRVYQVQHNDLKTF